MEEHRLLTINLQLFIQKCLIELYSGIVLFTPDKTVYSVRLSVLLLLDTVSFGSSYGMTFPV